MPGSRSPIRGGFTLIEMAAVTAIIGVLTLLLVSGVMSAREAARRAECTNRLRQLALALHAHEAARGVFPMPMPERWESHPGGAYGSVEDALSGFYDMLPYLELTPLYNAINCGNLESPVQATFLADSSANRTAYTMRVAHFLCPSDGMAARLPGGPNNYRFNVSRHLPIFDQLPDSGAFSPLYFWRRPRDYSDGLSTTVGLSERVVGAQASGFDRRRDFWAANAEGLVPIENADDILRICRLPVTSPAERVSELGSTWMKAGNVYIWYNHTAGPNERAPDCTATSLGRSGAGTCHLCSVAARSLHAGGVHVAMMDGSVRFARETVALSVWRALGTRAGGETIAEPW